MTEAEKNACILRGGGQTEDICEAKDTSKYEVFMSDRFGTEETEESMSGRVGRFEVLYMWF